MDASCKIQRSIHDVRLTYKYVSRILGTYQSGNALKAPFIFYLECDEEHLRPCKKECCKGHSALRLKYFGFASKNPMSPC